MKDIRTKINQEFGQVGLTSFKNVYRAHRESRVKYWAMWMLPVLLGLLFLPWTQNIKARGNVTTLRQEQRPQELNSIIAGRIVRWYIKEGDFVKAGDTIAQLTEIKDAYLDPKLVDRTMQQLEAKQASIVAYSQKAEANLSQIGALEAGRQLKLQQIQNKIGQLKLKIIADSMDVIAATNDYTIALAQFKRQKIMFDSGLTSLVSVEQKSQYYQTTNAKKISAEIKYTNTKTDYLNAQIEFSQTQQEYAEKIFKARGEQASVQSDLAAGAGEVAKLSNQYSNYKIRAGMYYLIAPQDCQFVKAIKEGNELVKEGDKLAEIVPTNRQLAIEMFVKPVDLPLLSLGQKVRFMFDGFPAIVFSGWPQASFGTFGGVVTAIESSAGYNGKFRVLVAEDRAERPWPTSVKLGTGASGLALLKDVPIYYELWRNINGFPPEYYMADDKGKVDAPKLKIKVK